MPYRVASDRSLWFPLFGVLVGGVAVGAFEDDGADGVGGVRIDASVGDEVVRPLEVGNGAGGARTVVPVDWSGVKLEPGQMGLERLDPPAPLRGLWSGALSAWR